MERYQKHTSTVKERRKELWKKSEKNMKLSWEELDSICLEVVEIFNDGEICQVFAFSQHQSLIVIDEKWLICKLNFGFVWISCAKSTAVN